MIRAAENKAMRYIKEKDLRDQFWKKYGYRKNIVAYQFECPARTGGVDLLTVEDVHDSKGDRIEFVSFEFKLDDMKKAFAQAYANMEFCHKSFIVVPKNKETVIKDRYMDFLKENRSIGCISVEFEGQWNMFHKALARSDTDLKLNQEILKMCCKIL